MYNVFLKNVFVELQVPCKDFMYRGILLVIWNFKTFRGFLYDVKFWELFDFTNVYRKTRSGGKDTIGKRGLTNTLLYHDPCRVIKLGPIKTKCIRICVYP